MYESLILSESYMIGHIPIPILHMSHLAIGKNPERFLESHHI